MERLKQPEFKKAFIHDLPPETSAGSCMKRDLNLIREILLEVESCANYRGADTGTIKAGVIPPDIIQYHIGLLVDAGLIDETIRSSVNPQFMPHFNVNLTWSGHEFLDNARNDSIWEAVKEKHGNKLESVSLGKLQALLQQAVLKVFEL